jgi:hypothetical protein
MEGAPDLEITSEMNSDAISLSFSAGKQYLKERVSYVFNNERLKPDNWGIATWSKKVTCLSILKHDNVSGKAHLTAATCYNQPRQQHNPCRMPLAHL